MSTRPTNSMPIEGVLVVGTRPRCGKTVLVAGMAASLLELGFNVQAFKPLEFTRGRQITVSNDQRYLDKLTGDLGGLTTTLADSPHTLENMAWLRMVDSCRKTRAPVLLEAPGSAASPLRYENGDVKDATDLARLLGIPVLLVAEKDADLPGQIVPTLTYLQAQEVELLGWAAVETRSASTGGSLPGPAYGFPAGGSASRVQTPWPHWEEEVLYITQRFQTQYLGELAFSPSISAEALQQGNLITLTQAGLDLLPLQLAMNVVLS